jgi:oligosaccharide repeat unit polymerase
MQKNSTLRTASFVTIALTALTGTLIYSGTTEAAIAAYVIVSLIIGLLFPLFHLRNHDLPLITLLVAHTFWFAIPAGRNLAAGATFGENAGYLLTSEELLQTVCYIVLFLIALTISYYVVKHICNKELIPRAAPRQEFNTQRLLALTLLLVGIGFLPFIVFGDSLGGMVAGILGSRGADKPWAQAAFSSNPLLVIGRSSFVAAGAISLLHSFKPQGFKTRIKWIGIFCFTFLITYLDSGTRSWTLLIIAPPTLIYLNRKLKALEYRKLIVIMPLVLLSVLAIAQIQLQSRDLGFGVDRLTEIKSFDIVDNDFFTETAIAVSLVPKQFDYIYQSHLWLFLTNPIPRAIWPDKPYPIVVELYGLGRSGMNEYRETGVSRMPSIVGQFYMNYGVWGVVLIGSFFGAVGALCSWVLKQTRDGNPLAALFATTTLTWLFVSFRGMYPGFHYPALILLCMLLLAKKTSLFRKVPSRVRSLAYPGPSAHGILVGGPR